MPLSTSSWQRLDVARSVPVVPIDPDRFAERLRSLERENLLTVEKAAQQIGMSHRHYVRWRKGEASPRYDSLEKVARAYGLDPHDLFADVADDEARAANGSLTNRLGRLEADVEEILRLLRETLPALAASLEAGKGRAGRSSARRQRATGS